MDGLLAFDKGVLSWHGDGETVQIMPWGRNSLRVRAGRPLAEKAEDWALLPFDEIATDGRADESQYQADDMGAWLTNGGIRAHIRKNGRVTFHDAKGPLLREDVRVHIGTNAVREIYSLGIQAREYTPLPGGGYAVKMRFEAAQDERIYGMGQYQEPFLNLKGCKLELAQRNSQASVPFYVSSRGYGFLWNNPAVGQAAFARNGTEWSSDACDAIDYWITAGDTPAAILAQYTAVTGRAPVMPEHGLGLWQCKLRYRTQEEILSVAREYKRRGLPLDVIVVDFFHWPKQGDWRFDARHFPDPEAMTRELDAMGVKLMVSVWPTVERESENYDEMAAKGLLARSRRGIDIQMYFNGESRFFDATNPAARAYIWKKCKQNYFDKGVSLFWLDEAEPEFGAYHYDQYEYLAGPVSKVGNQYPRDYARAFYDGMKAAGVDNPMHLIRCCWAGSQRYGALLWSGDISSSFESFRCQVAAGLNAGMAGIPWWTTDVGGFYGGNASDPAFVELLIRWFQWATFTPVLRMHGFRMPCPPQEGVLCPSGADNELWSYGEEAYEIMKKYALLREGLRPCLRSLMQAAHETGAPPMRPLFFDFPGDGNAWAVEDQFMLGPDHLVAPILYLGQRSRRVYLPQGCRWQPLEGGETLEGGRMIDCDAPICSIPVFVRVRS